MKTKRLIMLALVLVLAAGCGGGQFAEEKTLLTTVTKAMESFNNAIGSAGATDEVTKALGTFTDALETVLPKMQELNSAHPDWETNPPEELKETFDKYNVATGTFQTETMPKVMKFAQENAGNAEFQSALKKFGDIASKM